MAYSSQDGSGEAINGTTVKAVPNIEVNQISGFLIPMFHTLPYFTIVKCVVNTFLLYFLCVKRKAQAVCVKAISLLKEERERRKLSKYFVAQESGLSPQMIGYVESGTRNPTLETVLRMAEAINVNFEDLLKKARKEVGEVRK